MFTELGYDMNSPSTLCIDNRSAISVAKNPEHHGRMKHLDLRYYWLRERVEKGDIRLFHVPTKDMPADLLTKSLEKPKVLTFRGMMGLM